MAPIVLGATSAPSGTRTQGVVDIDTTLAYQDGTAAGTGMVQASSGVVLTNNHVIQGSKSIVVRDVSSSKRYRATVVGYDPADDVAVLRLAGSPALSGVSLGDSSSVGVGDAVTAVGNAGGVGGAPSVVNGTVTALHRAITVGDASGGTPEHLTDIIATKAALQPGDSGGPLLNSAGQVIGMNTAASLSFRVRTVSGGGGFAIPINTATTIAKQILAGRSSARVHIGATSRLGVRVASFTGLPGAEPVAGAAIADVTGGTPAARAGLSAGDTIVSLGGRRVASPAGLSNAMLVHHPGDTVTVVWVDQFGQRDSATVRLGTGPPA